MYYKGIFMKQSKKLLFLFSMAAVSYSFAMEKSKEYAGYVPNFQTMNDKTNPTGTLKYLKVSEQNNPGHSEIGHTGHTYAKHIPKTGYVLDAMKITESRHQNPSATQYAYSAWKNERSVVNILKQTSSVNDISPIKNSENLESKGVITTKVSHHGETIPGLFSHQYGQVNEAHVFFTQKNDYTVTNPLFDKTNPQLKSDRLPPHFNPDHHKTLDHQGNIHGESKKNAHKIPKKDDFVTKGMGQTGIRDMNNNFKNRSSKGDYLLTAHPQKVDGPTLILSNKHQPYAEENSHPKRSCYSFDGTGEDTYGGFKRFPSGINQRSEGFDQVGNYNRHTFDTKNKPSQDPFHAKLSYKNGHFNYDREDKKKTTQSKGWNELKNEFKHNISQSFQKDLSKIKVDEKKKFGGNAQSHNFSKKSGSKEWSGVIHKDSNHLLSKTQSKNSAMTHHTTGKKQCADDYMHKSSRIQGFNKSDTHATKALKAFSNKK